MAKITARTRKSQSSRTQATKNGWTWTDLLAPRIFGKKLPWYWSLIFVAVFLVLMDLSLRSTIRNTAYYMLSPLDSIASTSVRNVGYSLNGHLRVYDTALDFGDNSQGIKVREIDLETPGFWWVAQQLLPKSKPSKASKLLDMASGGSDDWYYPETPTLTLHLRNVDWGDYTVGSLIPALDWVGSYTGALFEAEGCPEDAFWSRDDLSGRLQLDPGRGDIQIRYEVTGDQRLSRKIHFGNSQLSDLTIESEYELPGPAKHWLDLLWEDWRTTRIRWTVNDHGFVKHRNQWCAEQAKIDVPSFIDRHLASVERILAANGLKADPSLMSTYKGYASEGLPLVWESNLAPGRAFEDYEEQSFDAILSAMAATLTVGDQVTSYAVSEIPERSFPDVRASTWEVIQIESGQRPAPPAPASAATPASVATAATPNAGNPSPVAAPGRNQTIGLDQLDQVVGLRVEVSLEGHRKLLGVIESIEAKKLHMKIRMGGGYAQIEVQRHRISSVRRI